jgi:type I restriction-modification system DNA methylase subunit
MNYSLFNQKITFEFLKSHLWAAADILRGSLDPADYRQPIMTLLFINRLNDTFEENAEKLINEGKSQKEAYENPALETVPSANQKLDRIWLQGSHPTYYAICNSQKHLLLAIVLLNPILA